MVRAFLVFGAMLVAWLSGYASGVWPWLGYASMTRSSFGAGPIAIVGENSRGIDIGLETFFFFEGQEVVIEYDTEIRQGSLWFYVYRPFDAELGKGESEYVTTNGKGVWRMPVHQTGVYRISIDTSPTRGNPGGWDMRYTVKWGARFARPQ